jgi:hypothetical protein
MCIAIVVYQHELMAAAVAQQSDADMPQLAPASGRTVFVWNFTNAPLEIKQPEQARLSAAVETKNLGHEIDDAVFENMTALYLQWRQAHSGIRLPGSPIVSTYMTYTCLQATHAATACANLALWRSVEATPAS